MSEKWADYRAKSLQPWDGDRWIYGFYVGAVGNVNAHLIVDGEINDDGTLDYRAIPYAHGSLCRNSYVTDHANVPIYENDVVCRRNEFGEQEGPVGIVRYGSYRDNDQSEAYNLGFWIDWKEEVPGLLRVELLFWTKETNLFVLGNIIDKPDLPSYLSPIKSVEPEDALHYLTERAAVTPYAEKQNYRVAVDAIARSIPRYPNKSPQGAWTCPCCKSERVVTYGRNNLVQEYTPFCGKCGQKIDWSTVSVHSEVVADTPSTKDTKTPNTGPTDEKTGGDFT